MRIVIIGLGSIGSNHLKLLVKNYNHDLLIYRSGKTRSKNKYNVRETYSWRDIKGFNPEVVFICNPTNLHISTAIKCAKLGYKLFIEKPIDSNTKNLKYILKLVKIKKIVSYIAYNLRFHPIITDIKKIVKTKKPIHCRISCTSDIKNWRNNSLFKKSYSLKKKSGGGVLLDLSHEIDYIDYIFDGIKSINGLHYKLSNITIDSEDCADLIIKTKKCIVNLHLNFISKIKERSIKIDFKNFSIETDLNTGKFIKHYSNKISSKKYIISKEKVYLNQLDYFFSNINNNKMTNNLEEASVLFYKLIKYKR